MLRRNETAQYEAKTMRNRTDVDSHGGMDRLAATLVCQGADIRTLRKNLEEAQDAMKSWNVGKSDPLDSESGAFLDRIGTSTSFANTVAKPVINHPPRASKECTELHFQHVQASVEHTRRFEQVTSNPKSSINVTRHTSPYDYFSCDAKDILCIECFGVWRT